MPALKNFFADLDVLQIKISNAINSTCTKDQSLMKHTIAVQINLAKFQPLG
ncbi:hypothetical protein DSUL_80073 [Desulfovibrionales bacterium]